MEFTIVRLLCLHFIADFVLQPREMGKKKSEDWRWLAGHLAIQFLVFFPFTSAWFALANCAVHGVIDWFIWRWYKVSVILRVEHGWNKDLFQDADKQGQTYRFWEDHMFFTTIGLDQLFHAITLVLLGSWLLK